MSDFILTAERLAGQHRKSLYAEHRGVTFRRLDMVCTIAPDGTNILAYEASDGERGCLTTDLKQAIDYFNMLPDLARQAGAAK
jgi:hypothetical protein